ncbi:LysR family transcriptional regulator, partial [Staphylococcus cohnii]
PIGNPFDYYIYFTALTKGVQNKYSVANTFITYIKQ